MREDSEEGMTASIAELLSRALAAHQAGQLDAAGDLYRSALAVEPQQADALHLLGLARFQQGETAAGAPLVRRALALAPDAGPFLETAAAIAGAEGGPLAVLAWARRGLALGASSNLLSMMGQAAAAAGDFEGARAAFAVLAERGSPEARLDVAFCLRRLGRWPEAARLYHALAAEARDPRPLAALAEMAAERSGHDAALPFWRRALALAPVDPALHLGVAASLFNLGRHGPAMAAFRRVPGITGTGAPELEALALMGLAGASYRLQEPEVSQLWMRRSLATWPQAAAAWSNASDLARESDPGRALAFVDRALAFAPADPNVWSNRGLALGHADRFQEARTAFRRAIALDPGDGRLLVNLGELLHLLGDFHGMRRILNRASGLSRDFVSADYMLALACMLLGDLPSAWRHYESRFKSPPAVRPRPFPQPWWDGRPASDERGGRILVWGEQGVGDEMLFGSMLPDLAARGVRAVVEVDARLVPSFARAFPTFEIVARLTPPDPRLFAPDISHQIAMGSLAGILRPSLDDFERPKGFLSPEPARLAHARRWLDGLGPGPRVGIAWRSKHQDVKSRRMHTALSEWGPILSVPGVRFVNLQYGDCEAELSAAEARFGVQIHRMPGLDLFNDLEGVIALSAGLDLIVSTITTAHIPGACCGVETWLLMVRTDYFALGRDHCPWMPNTRGFLRLPGKGWEGAISAAGEALRQLADATRRKAFEFEPE
jgi:tetratricopeptide (TPR) repeat protein